MAAGTMLMSFSHTFANRLMVQYGNEAIAAQGVAGKAGMLTSMLVMGICMGVQPAVSYTYGREDRRRLRKIVLGVGLVAVVISTVTGWSFLFFRDAFVRSFLNDPQVIAYGKQMVLGSVIMAPLFGIYQMCAVYLQGTGKVTYATITALMQKGIVYLPALYLMHSAFGLTGLIFTSAVTDAITTVAALLLCWLGTEKSADRTVSLHPAVSESGR
jgi:Na+-driven multidrug efflux pump